MHEYRNHDFYRASAHFVECHWSFVLMKIAPIHSSRRIAHSCASASTHLPVVHNVRNARNIRNAHGARKKRIRCTIRDPLQQSGT